MAAPADVQVGHVNNPPTSNATRNAPSGNVLFSGAAWLLVIALFAPVISWLVRIWTMSIYDAHGALVPLLVVGMIFAQRSVLAVTPRAPDIAGFALTGAGLLLLLQALLMNCNLLGGVALVAVVAGMVWTLWGRAVLRLLAFPLVFLLLMLPLNYPLEILLGFRLRLLATKLSAMFLTLLGLKINVHGTIIATSQFAVAIESPCSGLKTLSALLLAGIVLAYFQHKSWWQRGLIVLLVPPVALLANALRNTAIILIGHNYGQPAAMGWLHAFSGLMTFLLAVALLILISETLLWRRKPAST